MSTDSEHLQWLHDRLVNVYGENENFDYMHRLRKIIKPTIMKKSTWRFLWENPFILAILMLIWAACSLTIIWFANVSGETDPFWIGMFCTLPVGTSYLSWLIVKMMYHGEIFEV